MKKQEATSPLGTVGTDRRDAFDRLQAITEDALMLLPDGTGEARGAIARLHESLCARAFDEGAGTWCHLVRAAAASAMTEADPKRLTAALFQLATIVECWLQVISARELHAERHREAMAKGEAVA